MPNYSAIADELKNRQQWCCWKTLQRDNKPTKIPINPLTGKNAESNNPETWCSFEQAVEFYQEKLKSQYEVGKAGIGFFLSEDDPYSFIDIDNCIVNGKPNQETQSVVKKFHSYTDVSPSNSGIHIIVKAEKPGDKCRTGKVDWCSHVEIYDKLRYFTFTGNILNGHNAIGSRQKELSEFYNELFPKVIPFKKSKSSKTVFTKKNWDDQTLIQTAFNAGNGNKFQNLWSGNWKAEGYPSQSEADLAFCEILVFWTQGDRARTDKLFRQSGLFREKWERDDYRKRTLDKALEKVTEYYKPQRNWTHSPQSQQTTQSANAENSNPKEKREEKPTEESDSTDKTSTSKPEFYPTPIAKRLLAQNDFIWQFVTEQDQFYQYGDGVWSQIDEGYLEKAIRNILFNYSPDWDNKHKRTEVIAALKDHLIDPAIASRFNPGTNPNLKLINVKNGMLNWRTGEILQHSKDYYSTCQLNVEYNPEAQSELWEQSLKQWIPEKQSRMFVQEFSGYCLIPDTSFHRSVILVGAGSNGKSTFLYAIEQLFGEDNLSSIPMEKLPARFEIARIQHMLVNICADIESGYIEQTSDIKKIISGDTLRGELKYKSSFDFTPITRLWFSCNEIPKASDRSEAWYRRFEFITFPNRFEGSKKDPELKQKLVKPEVRSAVLNWAIAGLQRLSSQGEFTISDEMSATKELYELENDNTAAFIDEMLEYPVDNSVPKAWLYQQYQNYCKESGTKPLAKVRFESRLKANGIQEKRTNVKLCRTHRNFRCNVRDEAGYLVCEDSDFEQVTQRCFFGIDLKDETLTLEF